MADQSSSPPSPEEKILAIRRDRPTERFGVPLLAVAGGEVIAIVAVNFNVQVQLVAFLLTLLCLVAGVLIVIGVWTIPITFDCPHCGGLISNLVPWQCGYCGEVHASPEYSWLGSFLGRCAACGSSPKAYRCVHCGSIIRLQEGGDLTRHAFTRNRPAPEETQVTPVPPPAVQESPIARMLRPIQDRQQRREALMQYERQTRREIRDRKDLNEQEKEGLLSELAIDIEQVRMMDD